MIVFDRGAEGGDWLLRQEVGVHHDSKTEANPTPQSMVPCPHGRSQQSTPKEPEEPEAYWEGKKDKEEDPAEEEERRNSQVE